MPSAVSDAPVFLVGMMGAGKSTLGAALAKATARPFVDLDALVEQRAGESIAAMLAAGRERDFRAREHEALRAIEAERAVVATGGGIVLDGSNVDFMLQAGRVAYLRARPETLARRLDGEARPLLQGHADRVARLRTLLAERSPAYERAHRCFDTDELVPDGIVAELIDWMEVRRG